MARKLIVEIIGDSTSYQRAIAKSEQANRRFAETAKRTGRHMAKLGLEVAAVAGVIGVLASREFSDFEGSMNKIIGLVGVSREQVHAWHEDLLKLGPEVAKSPKELADALFFITSAGLRGETALDALSVAAHASAAGMGETKTVADALTSAMNAYGQANLSATQAADVLVATVREGKTEAASLAPVIGNVAAFASALGIEFNEVGAALAAQTRITGDAKSASVQLTNVLSTLAKGAPKTRKGFAAVGLNLDQVRDTLAKPGGLLKALFTLKNAFGGNVAATAQAFGNIRALRGVLALVGKSADQTRAIFKRLATTTEGSVGRAFAAISEDEGFQFERTLQSLRVVGIKLGAMLEPLANTIAKSLTAAFGKVSEFLDGFKKARTVRAKLDFIWETTKGAAERLTNLVKSVFNQIDWTSVLSGASGITKALEDRIQEVDWSLVGKQFGAAFKKTGDFITPVLKNLTEILSKTLHDLDWEAIGVSAGPGLLTAMLSAFRALLDPGFWARNWQLALSVAIDALGLLFPELFGIRKLLAMFAKPFAKLIAPLGRAIGTSVSSAFARAGSFLIDQAGRISERLATALAADLIRLPGVLAGLVDRIFGGFFRKIAARFEKLGELARFTLRLLGISAFIRTVERVVHKVADLFRDLGGWIQKMWDRVMSFMHRRALKAALQIIEPFTHLPGFLGGGTFRRLKEQWQTTLSNMETDTASSVVRTQSIIDGLHGKNVVIELSPQITGRDTGGHEQPRTTGGLDVGTGGTTNKKATDKVIDDATTGSGDTKSKAERLQDAADKAQTAFDRALGALDLKLDKAKVTRTFKDDLAVLRQIEDAIRDRIRVVGRTTDLTRQLFDNLQEQNQVAKDARRAAQFEALGLTAEGDKPTPSSGALLKRAKGMLAMLKGTSLDTKANRQQLKRIISVLKANFKTAGREVRQAILQMLNDIAGAADSDQAKGPLTSSHGLRTKKIIEGLGLTPDQAREIRSRLAHATTPGGGGTVARAAGSGSRGIRTVRDRSQDIVVESHTTINVDGHTIANVVTRNQQRDRRRNPRQKRGQHRK